MPELCTCLKVLLVLWGLAAVDEGNCCGQLYFLCPFGVCCGLLDIAVAELLQARVFSPVCESLRMQSSCLCGWGGAALPLFAWPVLC